MPSPIHEAELNELHSALPHSDSQESALERITTLLLQEPLKAGLLKRGTLPYYILREVIRFEAFYMGDQMRDNDDYYSVHTDLVMWNGAKLKIMKEGSSDLDLALLIALKLHDLPEEFTKRPIDKKILSSYSEEECDLTIQQNCDKLFEGKENSFLKTFLPSYLPAKFREIPEQMLEVIHEARRIIQKITFLRRWDYFTAVDEAGDRRDFDPREILVKLIDANHNNRTLDKRREFNGDLTPDSLHISSDNLVHYPVPKRFFRMIKDIHLLYRSLGCISRMRPNDFLRTELLHCYGGITTEDSNTTIKDTGILRSTPFDSMQQFSGLFGSTYLELRRIAETVRANNPKNISDFDEIDQLARTYKKLREINMPSKESPFDGTLDTLFLLGASEVIDSTPSQQIELEERKRDLKTEPNVQYGPSKLLQRLMDEILIDPTIMQTVKGLHSKHFREVLELYQKGEYNFSKISMMTQYLKALAK